MAGVKNVTPANDCTGVKVKFKARGEEGTLFKDCVLSFNDGVLSSPEASGEESTPPPVKEGVPPKANSSKEGGSAKGKENGSVKDSPAASSKGGGSVEDSPAASSKEGGSVKVSPAASSMEGGSVEGKEGGLAKDSSAAAGGETSIAKAWRESAGKVTV